MIRVLHAKVAKVAERILSSQPNIPSRHGVRSVNPKEISLC